MALSENEITLNELTKTLQIYHEYFNFSRLVGTYTRNTSPEVAPKAFKHPFMVGQKQTLLITLSSKFMQLSGTLGL